MFNKATLAMALLTLSGNIVSAVWYNPTTWFSSDAETHKGSKVDSEHPTKAGHIRKAHLKVAKAQKKTIKRKGGFHSAFDAIASGIPNKIGIRVGPDGNRIYKCSHILNAPGKYKDICEFFSLQKRIVYSFPADYEKQDIVKLRVGDKCECAGSYVCEKKISGKKRWNCHKGQLKETSSNVKTDSDLSSSK